MTTRREEIKKASLQKDRRDGCYAGAWSDGFVSGAEWADENSALADDYNFECDLRRECQRKLSIAVEALKLVDQDYEIDWADKARLREFIKNQRMHARRALAEIKGEN